MSVLFCAPDPSLRGGVNAAVAALLPKLPEARRVTVGRTGALFTPWNDPARLRREKGEVAVFNTSMRARAFGRDLALLAAWSRPAALWIHGGSDRFWSGLPPVMVRRLAQRALLVALSERFGARLIRKGADPARVRVIPPPYDPQVLPGRRAPRDVLFLGRLTREKGAFALLDAFAEAELPGARLILAGVGPAHTALGERARALGVASRVVMPGWLEGASKTAALASAAVVALPSLDEAVPVCLIEAMACGVPVVATDVGAVSETVGPAGIVVPVGDVRALSHALTLLVAEPEGRAEAGRLAARKHHPEVVAEQWRCVLGELR